jgi:spore coat polysaccharide biosynthesis protein SpsF (cytidylyltransferase family)
VSAARLRPIAVIQARMGSSRLPGKVLADLGGAPLLARMIERVRGARRVAAIVVATPEGPLDEPVRELARHLGVGAFAGSAEDVLARYQGAATRFAADPVVRLTADCPLIDPEVIDACVERFAATGCDYAGLAGEFPDGLDTEVIAAGALARAAAEARLPSEREHVTPYLKAHPDRFRCVPVEFPERLGERRWTVDEARDLAFVREVYRRLYQPGRIFGWREIEALLAREPELGRLNAGIERNAGYRRSLERDRARMGGA